jgi:hypothetical protein
VWREGNEIERMHGGGVFITRQQGHTKWLGAPVESREGGRRGDGSRREAKGE